MRDISIDQAHATNIQLINDDLLGKERFLITYNDYKREDYLTTYFIDDIYYIKPVWLQTKIIPKEIYNDLIEMANKTNKTEISDPIDEDEALTKVRIIESNMAYEEFYAKFYNTFNIPKGKRS